MKPKETANRIMDIIGKAEGGNLTDAARWKEAKAELFKLCSELTALEPSYGHAAKIHKLTGEEPPECKAPDRHCSFHHKRDPLCPYCDKHQK